MECSYVSLLCYYSYQRLVFRHKLYQLREERDMKPETFASLVSAILYEKRFLQNKHFNYVFIYLVCRFIHLSNFNMTPYVFRPLKSSYQIFKRIYCYFGCPVKVALMFEQNFRSLLDVLLLQLPNYS